MAALRDVIQVVPNISAESSGPSYSVVRLCETLVALGRGVTLLTLDTAPLQKPPTFLRRFPVGLGPSRFGRSPSMYRWLARRCEQSAPSIIHNHSLWMMPNIYPGWVAARTGTPLIISPRGTLSSWAMASGSRIKRLVWPMIQRPVLEQATCFHATGDAEYEDIRRMGFRQPVAVIPNGIDLPQIDSRAQKKAARTLLYLGRLHPIKGLDVLLRAWHKLQLIYPTWTLRLAGPDARGFLSQLRALERDLGLERVQFLGELNGAAKWDELRAAEIFVLPSYSENFGVAVAEALASGVPAVVSTAAPWQGLEGRGAGWWVEPTVQGVLSALHHAMKLSPEELRAMGTKGRTWMQEEFSWHFIGTRMNITYEWMDCGGTAPPWIRLN